MRRDVIEELRDEPCENHIKDEEEIEETPNSSRFLLRRKSRIEVTKEKLFRKVRIKCSHNGPEAVVKHGLKARN